MNVFNKIALLIGAALAIIGLPLVAIMAINHLFGTDIAFTFWNWAAVAFLILLINSGARS